MEHIDILMIYKGCLAFGLVFSVLTLILGDFIDDALESLFSAVMPGDSDFSFSIVVTFLSVFGGIGLFFSYNTDFGYNLVFVLSALVSCVISSAFYFLYLKPMQESENSVAFSVSEFVGKMGEVVVPISKDKYGEVIIQVGISNVNKVATSSAYKDIPTKAQVYVDKVEDGILYVTEVDKL